MISLMQWWKTRHTPRLAHEEIRKAYQRCFATPDGQVVMKHLLDNIYGIVYEGTDQHEAAILNWRRTVVYEILDNATAETDPERRTLKEEEPYGSVDHYLARA